MKNYKIAATLKGHDEASSTFARVGRNVRRSLGGAFRNVATNVRGFGRALTSLPVLGGVLGGAFGVGKLAEWVTDFAAAGDTIAKTSQVAGVSTGFFQRLGHAAGLAGVAAEDFANAVTKFAVNMGAMRGKSGELYSFLRQVSPALLKALKATTGNEQALRLYMEAIASVPDPAKRAKLAVAAFGRSGERMALLAGEGADGINKMMGEADRLGLVLSGDALKSAEEFSDEVDRLKGAWGGLKAIFGTAFIQAALPYLKQATEWLKDNKDKVGALAKGFAVDLVEGIKKVVEALPKIATALASIAGYIAKIVDKVSSIPAPVLALLGGGLLVRKLGGAAAGAGASGVAGAAGAAAGGVKGVGAGAAKWLPMIGFAAQQDAMTAGDMELALQESRAPALAAQAALLETIALARRLAGEAAATPFRGGPTVAGTIHVIIDSPQQGAHVTASGIGVAVSTGHRTQGR